MSSELAFIMCAGADERAAFARAEAAPPCSVGRAFGSSLICTEPAAGSSPIRWLTSSSPGGCYEVSDPKWTTGTTAGSAAISPAVHWKKSAVPDENSYRACPLASSTGAMVLGSGPRTT